MHNGLKKKCRNCPNQTANKGGLCTDCLPKERRLFIPPAPKKKPMRHGDKPMTRACDLRSGSFTSATDYTEGIRQEALHQYHGDGQIRDDV